jgi:hypothetical protein
MCFDSAERLLTQAKAWAHTMAKKPAAVLKSIFHVWNDFFVDVWVCVVALMCVLSFSFLGALWGE